MTSANLAPSVAAPRLRSGAAARLAGLPVTTLRVWERRYGVVDAPKTVTGQRLYSNQDVMRLRLLRQLTERGHAIGTIAALPFEPLQALAAGLDQQAAAPVALAEPGAYPRCRVVTVGRSAAHKLSEAAGPSCEFTAVHDDLDQAEAQADPPALPEALVVRLPTLQPSSAARVLALAARWRAARLVVVYAFGAEPVAQSLREAGARVRREPVSPRELADMVLGAGRPESAAAVPAAFTVAPRRFSDESLSRLAAQHSPIACECLRHVAEITMQLAGFERYSEECTSRSAADAALHRHLSAMAGFARTLFEQALDRIAAHEALEPILTRAP